MIRHRIKSFLIRIQVQKLHEGVPKKRKQILPSRKEYLEQLEFDQCTFIPEINKNTSNKYYSPNKPVLMKQLELHNDFIKRKNKLNEIRYTVNFIRKIWRLNM